MIRTVDTILTIGAFGFAAIPVAACASPWGWMVPVLFLGELPEKEDKLRRRVALSAIVICPLLLAVILIATIVLACHANGLTFYYPLIALPVELVAWYASAAGIAWGVEEIEFQRWNRKTRPNDGVVKPDPVVAEMLRTAPRSVGEQPAATPKSADRNEVPGQKADRDRPHSATNPPVPKKVSPIPAFRSQAEREAPHGP